MQERLGDGLEHILQRADAGEDHGDVQNDGEEPAERDVLQDGRQRHEQQARARADVQPVGKAGGDDNERGDDGGNGVKNGRVLRHAHDVLVLGQVRAVDDHAAAGDGQGEKRLPHGPDPDHRILERLPARGEHELVALGRAGQQRHAHCQHQKDDEKQRHHDLVGLFDAVRAEKERQQRAGHDDDVVGDDGVRLRGKRREPHGGVARHERAEQGVDKRLEDVRHDDGVADGDAQRPGQRQPAEQAADLSGGLAARGPRAFIGAERAGAGAAAHGELRRQADGTEDDHKQQVDQQEGPAAVAAHLVREAPDVGHADGRADGRQDKAPAAGKAFRVFRFHAFSHPDVKNICAARRADVGSDSRFRCALPVHSGFILKYCSGEVKKNAGSVQKSGRVSCGFDEYGRKSSASWERP